MTWLLWALVVWLVASFPLAVLIGRLLKHQDPGQ